MRFGFPMSVALVMTIAACGESEPPSLVGTWRELHSPGQGEVRRTFAADGSYDVDGPSPMSGRYQVSLTNVSFPDWSAFSTVTRICDFEVTDDRLMLCALRPTGAIHGVVGHWYGVTPYRDSANQLTQINHTLDLYDDGTLLFQTVNGFDEPILVDGSWSMQGESLNLATGIGTFEFGTLPGVIGMYPAERLN
jgi:hypothetical protein